MMEKLFTLGGRSYRFTYEEDVEIGFTLRTEEDGVRIYRVTFKWKEAVSPKPIVFSYKFPCTEMYTAWDAYDRCRDLNVRWPKRGITESRLASGMPLKGLVSKSGENAYLLAVSDVKSPLSIKFGISDHAEALTEDVRLVFFTALTGPFLQYEADLRIDERRIPFDGALADARAWFDSLGYPQAHVPQDARAPMYSTWYSYEKEITAESVLRECREAVKLGMRTVIIDDGWQTDAPNDAPFYAYCGDFLPSEKKFPDLRGTVDRIHALGMKVMLWFPVPYIGYRADRYGEFAGRYLYGLDGAECSVLDPRYPSVRAFLVKTYTDAVERWDLDGLKLDFIDRFKTNGKIEDGMDFVSVEDAVECLLGEITAALKRIRPEILIEFRQPYFGPVVSAYGNMIRVMDCPLDGVFNKDQTLNLRLVAGNCAVHSDMMYWHGEETPEGVAIQLLGTLFSVPQISVRMEEITDGQRAALKNYLDFWNAHQRTLTEGKLHVRVAANGYGYAEATLGGETVALAVTDTVLSLGADTERAYAFNLTDADTLVVRTAGAGKVTCEVFDCTGKRIGRKRTLRGRLSDVAVPHGGMMKLTRA